MKTSHHSDEDGLQKDATPPQEPVWVQCAGYRCLAVLDAAGKWRSYHNHALLHDVIHVLGFGSGKDNLGSPPGH